MALKTKKTICLVVGIASILTIIGTISFAYFTAMGDMKPVESMINTATVSVRFTDNDTGITGELSFGESLTKKFTITNTGTAEANVKMYWQGLVNTYLEDSLTYTLSYSETEEGPYTEIVNKTNVPRSKKSSNKILADLLTIPFGKTYYYNLTVTLNYLNDINQDEDLLAVFYTNFDLKDINYIKTYTSLETLKYLNLVSSGTRTNFDEQATTDEGIFEMEDDYGTSYYYRGAVSNNYVKFAGFYWRIIRINGDGSLRIIYDGTSIHANGESSNDRFIKVGQPYNKLIDDNKYVGWMFGPANITSSVTTPSTSKEEAQSNVESSDIKKVVDTWYKENIEDKEYSQYLSDVLFCNDRNTPGQIATGENKDTGYGYSKHFTAYGATARFGVWNSNNSPTLKCPDQNDAFTANDTTKGNGKLTYPVGLVTADELVIGGSGKWRTQNINYYLYKSSEYYMWSISPCYYSSSQTDATMFMMNMDGSLYYKVYTLSSMDGAVAPVINLSAEYANTLIGHGTMDSPFHSIEDTI